MRSSPPLPIEEIFPQLDAVLATGGRGVVVAPPGAGKSTVLPLYLLDKIKEGLIILVEPRRLVARSCARRMAALLGEKIGERVGYRMRFDEATSRKTRLLVVTQGVFNRMLLDDPSLPNIRAVLLDEFHERSLEADFGLALALDVQSALCPDLILLVMSATLDGARVADLMGDAPVFSCEGRSFDISIRYQPKAPTKPLDEAMRDAIRTSLAQEQGNILAFLPGQAEIKRTLNLLEGRVGEHVLLVPLYGALDMQAQDSAIKPPPAGKRKVVLATSIAESALTIEGIRLVIDSGFSRIPVYESASGMTRLETVRASQASITQRAGRAGRLESGIAIRLWHEGQTSSLIPFDRPEILSADLSSLLLDCAAFGVVDPATLNFLDPPPKAALVAARHLLRQLGALDDSGRVTPKGQIMRSIALPVRYAHMVASASTPKEVKKAAEIGVLLSERGLGGDDVSVEVRYECFMKDNSPRAHKARQLAAHIAAGVIAHNQMQAEDDNEDDDDMDIARLLLAAWPDRVAKARQQPGGTPSFLMANGRAALMEADHFLSRAVYLVIADVAGKARNLRILAAASIDEETIRAEFGSQITSHLLHEFDEKSHTIRARLREKLGSLELGERPLVTLTGDEANQAWVAAVCRHGTHILPWSHSARSLRQRLDWLYRTRQTPWPDVSEQALQYHAEEWLHNFLPGLARFNEADIKGRGDFLHTALLARLDYQQQRQLGSLAPVSFKVPSGRDIPIHYEGDNPALSVRVQELFGLDQHPTIAEGEVKLVVELLSPAHRPIQITRDLPTFWRGSWADVRLEMRGRYPKHIWPENPLSATPTKHTKPRSS